ncbi:MAG: hypothetical protein ACE5JU_06470 [Candidatus Binatia bacterium]
MPLVFTPQMKKRLSRRARSMLQVALRRFPELSGKNITVGYTHAHLGSSVLPRHAGSMAKLTIRLKVRKLTYNTIGHELTHLVQGLCQFPPRESRRAATKFPRGEKQCDIWTLARSELFCDDAPTYLRLPRAVRKKWPRYAEPVRSLCIAAIKKRQTHRFYIRWLETQIKQLARKELQRSGAPRQLVLPFDD